MVEKQNIEHMVKVVINLIFIKSVNFAHTQTKGGGSDP